MIAGASIAYQLEKIIHEYHQAPTREAQDSLRGNYGTWMSILRQNRQYFVPGVIQYYEQMRRDLIENDKSIFRREAKEHGTMPK